MSMKKQKRSYDNDQTVDVACRCRGCKKTLCHHCKKSSKKIKLLKAKATDKLREEPQAVSVPSAVTEVDGSSSGSRYWDVNFTEYFSQNFKKVDEIKSKGWGCKTKLFGNKMWCAMGSHNLMVYSARFCKHLKTIDINFPRSVDQAENGDIFIACYNNSGLYVMDANGAPQKISEGSFADVYSHRDKVYAFECKQKLIIQFCCVSDIDDVMQSWISEQQWSIDEASLCDRLIVTGDEDLQFYVSHYYTSRICQYNTHGQCIKQFGGRYETGDWILNKPWLCGVDRQSHLLVADGKDNMYKILNPGTGEWRSTGLSGHRWIFDATLDDDGNLWLSQQNGKEFIITKYEPQ